MQQTVNDSRKYLCNIKVMKHYPTKKRRVIMQFQKQIDN